MAKLLNSEPQHGGNYLLLLDVHAKNCAFNLYKVSIGSVDYQLELLQSLCFIKKS